MKAMTRNEFAELAKTVKPRLRRELRFVPEEISDWSDRDFLAVMNRGKTEGVLVFEGRPTPFQLQKRRPNRAGRVEAIICDFCATWQRGANSAIITFPKEKSARSFLVCGDLDCSLHVRDKTPAAQLSRVQLRETNTAEGRTLRLKARLETILGHQRDTPSP